MNCFEWATLGWEWVRDEKEGRKAVCFILWWRLYFLWQLDHSNQNVLIIPSKGWRGISGASMSLNPLVSSRAGCSALPNLNQPQLQTPPHMREPRYCQHMNRHTWWHFNMHTHKQTSKHFLICQLDGQHKIHIDVVLRMLLFCSNILIAKFQVRILEEPMNSEEKISMKEVSRDRLLLWSVVNDVIEAVSQNLYVQTFEVGEIL